MARNPRILHRSWAGGEITPEMYGRVDDVKFQAGAAKIQNLLVKPHGPVIRRPGLQLVRAAGDSSSRVRLLPFIYSNEQSVVIEAGRKTSDGRAIGYFRFHTDAATLLYEVPRTYETPKNSTANVSNHTLGGLTGHGLVDGDPIVMTIYPGTQGITFDHTTDTITFTLFSTSVSDNTAIVFRADTANGGVLPTGIEPFRIYYTTNVAGNNFKILDFVGGSVVNFTDNGTPGTGSGPFLATMPVGQSEILRPNTTYYARWFSSTEVRIALSRQDAINGNYILLSKAGLNGSGGLKVHYDYRPGDLVNYTLSTTSAFYCIKIPWGNPGNGYCIKDEHDGHPPSNGALNYWFREPGSQLSVVTFDDTTGRVQITGHGLGVGTPVIFDVSGGSLPTGVAPGIVYYVRQVETDYFRFSLTPAGPLINFTGAGSGTMTALGGSFYEVPHFYEEDALFEVSYAQSGDVLTLTHQRYPVAELSRLGASRWILSDVAFNTHVNAPGNLTVTVERGQGWDIVSIDTSGSFDGRITLGAVGTGVQSAAGGFDGETVRIDGLPSGGVNQLVDGFYTLHPINGQPTNYDLAFVDSGLQVDTSPGSYSGGAVMRFASFSSELEHEYVVTAVLENREESKASASVTATNNLIVAGAYNQISWALVANAVRYRIYKKQNGLFGYIGETEETTFKDNNIGPDLGVTPPIPDSSLLCIDGVTFEANNFIYWYGELDLANGMPIIFNTTGYEAAAAYGSAGLPDNLLFGKPYYVINWEKGDGNTPGSFQISETLGGAVFPPGSNATAGSFHYAKVGFWPAAVAYFEQRRCFGGALNVPQDLWMTASGTEADLRYSLPLQDSDRIYVRIAARQGNIVRHIVPLAHLLVLTSTVEYRVTPINDDALTPDSISIRPQSYIGSNLVQPVVVNGNVLFAAARGGHLRETGFSAAVNAFVTGDLSLRAAALFDDYEIVQLDFSRSPQQIVWGVSSSGVLVGLTYMPDEAVGAWHRHQTDGSFESIAVVPEAGEDRVYVVVKRGSTRIVERMAVQAVNVLEDYFGVDSGLSYSGSPTSVVSGLDHLEGKTVAILADGKVQTSKVVSGGQITLSTAASKVHVGLPYTAELISLPVIMQVQAYGSLLRKNINHVGVRVFESGAFEIGPLGGSLVRSQQPSSGVLLTDLVEVSLPPSWNDDGQVVLRQSDPLPLTLVALTIELAPGG